MIKDIINRNLVCCEPDAKVRDVAKLMEKENVGAVLVIEEDRPRGIITDRDIVVRCVAENVDIDDTTVENIHTESVATVSETDGLFDCIRKMNEAKARRMPVVDENGKAVGMISFGDVLAILSRELEELTSGTTIAEEVDIGRKVA